MMRRRTWLLAFALAAIHISACTWMFAQKPRLKPRGFGEFSSLGEEEGEGEPEGQEEEERARPRRGGGQTTFQKIERTQGGYSVRYGFKNFNGDALSIQSELSSESVAESIREFGFRQADFDAVDAWYKKAQEDAIDVAKHEFASGKVTAPTQAELTRKLKALEAANAAVQRQLDATLAALAQEYRRRRLEVYTKAGFKFKGDKVVEVDIPGMVRRNAPRMRPLAQRFSEISAKRGYGAEEVVGAVTAMVQTALRYEIPATQEGTRTIGGVIPPPKALILGQGDCDTKTALLSSVLKNWPNLRMVGLGIPQHYLMAVHRVPGKGDVFIEYDGLPYVMIESAGPAWIPPGQVGDSTQAYLEAGKEFRIQPL